MYSVCSAPKQISIRSVFVSVNRIGELRDEDWIQLIQTADSLSAAQIYIDDTAGITAMEMRSRARRLKAEHGLDLIVVDYLQLMQGSGKLPKFPVR